MIEDQREENAKGKGETTIILHLLLPLSPNNVHI